MGRLREVGCRRVFAFLSAGVDTKANASRGSGALEVGDLCLVEDGSERSGALGSYFVASETVRARVRIGTARE